MTEPTPTHPALAGLVALAEQWDRPTMVGIAPRLRAAIAEASARLGVRLLPDPSGGCACTGHTESRGGTHSEMVVEYEPACPEHSEHLYDPRQGMWMQREAAQPVEPTIEVERAPTPTKSSGEAVDLLAALQRSVAAAKKERATGAGVEA